VTACQHKQARLYFEKADDTQPLFNRLQLTLF
jgi:hypothetical protein